MEGGGDHGVSGGGHGCSGGFATFLNYQNHSTSFFKSTSVPIIPALDRFLSGRNRFRSNQTHNSFSKFQNQQMINESFISSNGGYRFSGLNGAIETENGIRFPPSLPMMTKSFAVNDDVFTKDVGESLNWDELRNYPNYDPNRDSNQVIDHIPDEEISRSTRRPKGGENSKVLIKGQWSDEEDRKLIRLVNQYGIAKWAIIADKMDGRAGKQCRERWRNHLRPDIKKDTWSEEEVRMLIEAHQRIGNKWAEIAKIIPGRTENSIKNQWNATKRRQNSGRKFKKIDTKNRSPQASLLQDYIRSQTSDQNNLASSSSSTTTTTTTSAATALDETLRGSAITFPDQLAESNSNDSDSTFDITHSYLSYDDELNFMQTLFPAAS